MSVLALKWGAISAVVLALMAGSAAAAWLWQTNRYERQLADRARVYGEEREAAAVAVLRKQDEDQAVRRGLEDRLKANDQTHYKELTDEQKTQARLRDRLATADLRLSVLLDATDPAGGCGMPATAGTVGVVLGAARAGLDPAHAQRIIAITGDGDRALMALMALKACQAYVREVTR